ncbi:MAG: hypothetical protein V4456_02830 [Bacteroidota bacterium]
MATDKKINELPVISSVAASDVSVLVHNGTDYQYSFTTLLEFIQAGVNPGANISFGTTLPQNTTGKNGDVFINTAAGSFAQKQSGAWLVKYTLPAIGDITDGTVLYGSGAPGSGIGSNGDTYINIDTGIFYHKATGAWAQVFSMQTGPQGPKGDKGDTGITGANGKTILNGTSNPSNSTTGANGDFYLNTNTYQLFGPKADSVWGLGISIIGLTGEQGEIGPQGEIGLTGEPGVGVTAGGTIGQVLSKMSDADFDTGWVDVAAGSGGETATETAPGIIEIATISEALARTDDQRAMTALKTIALILDEKKKVTYQINPISVNEVSVYMENSGQVNSVLISGASSAKLKISLSGTYPVGTQTFPFAYAAGERVFITYNYSDLNNASCNVKLKCQDN